jgi:hypothetical protein
MAALVQKMEKIDKIDKDLAKASSSLFFIALQ